MSNLMHDYLFANIKHLEYYFLIWKIKKVWNIAIKAGLPQKLTNKALKKKIKTELNKKFGYLLC